MSTTEKKMFSIVLLVATFAGLFPLLLFAGVFPLFVEGARTSIASGSSV